MEELYSLIKCLTSAEWQSLQQYFTCFSGHDADRNKSLQLASVLRNSETEPTENFCSHKIYGKKQNAGFKMLKSRVKGKVLDFMLTDISCDKKQELDHADYVSVWIKKRSALFHQLFYSKKRSQSVYGMLDEIISLAKEYEKYYLLTEHLKFKRDLLIFKSGEKEYENATKEIKYYSECDSLMDKAVYYYYKLMMLHDYEGRPDKEKILLLTEKAINEISKKNARIKSPQLNYYLKFFNLEQCELNKNYLKAKNVCRELLKIVRHNKSVYRRQRVGVVYDNLSRYEYCLGNYKQAIICAREAQKNFVLNSENYCIALEQEFYALFAQEKYADAVIIAKKMLNSATVKVLGEFRHSKYSYLLSNALFKLGKFSSVLTLLSSRGGITKDKRGWEIGARLLKIMTLLEMFKLEEASLAVIGLKQFMKNNDKKTPISLRDKTILKLFLYAERQGFMFGTLNGKSEGYLTELNSNDEKLRWEPFTHELIPIHKWMAEKMKIKLKPVKAAVPKEKEKELVLLRNKFPSS